MYDDGNLVQQVLTLARTVEGTWAHQVTIDLWREVVDG